MKIKSISGDTIITADGKSHDLDPDATVTLDGKDVSIGELRAGDEVQIRGNPATSVTATRAK